MQIFFFLAEWMPISKALKNKISVTSLIHPYSLDAQLGETNFSLYGRGLI